MSGKQIYQQEEQIRRYLQDQMTEAERHAFEQEMQRDPFLTEAVEGLSSVTPDLAFTDLAELRKRIVKPERNRRYIWMTAASVLILIVSSLVFLNLQENTIPIISENKIQEAVKPKAISGDEKTISSQRTTNLVSERKLEKPLVVISDELVVEDAEMESGFAISLKTVDSAFQPSMDTTVSQQFTEMEIKISDATDQTSSSQISYITAPKAQNKMVENMSVMEKSELNEVVVVGYGTQKKSSVTGSVSSVKTKQMIDGKASPVVGWRAFEEYLKAELSAPKIGKPGTKTIVKLSFVITESGKKEQYQILKGKDETYNKEAIRIIIDGPAWMPEVREKTPQKSVVKLKLVFRP